MNIDWKRKLSSRKLWVALAGLIVGLYIYLGGKQEDANAIEGIIMSIASIVTYILAEAVTDAAHGADNDDESD